MSEVVIETSRGTLTLPDPAKLPSGAIRRARKTEDPVEQFFAIIEGIFPDGSPELALVDTIPVDELAEVFMTWLGGATLGESSGSSTSANDESLN